jgi:hypothetical protein
LTLHELGYMPSRGDLDVYLCPAVKLDGAQYYEMLLVYVDDILHITHHKALEQNETMKEIGRIYQLNHQCTLAPTWDAYWMGMETKCGFFLQQTILMELLKQLWWIS